MKNAFILKKEEASDVAFYEFWSKQYFYPKEYLYTENIHKVQATVQSINSLFTWKNGKTLAEKKAKSLPAVLNHWSKLKDASKEGVDETFALMDKFDIFPTGFIWRIFLLHILQPNKYPIFDRYTCAAYMHSKDQLPEAGKGEFLLDFVIMESKKVETYKNYLVFIESEAKSLKTREIRNIDKALFAFGMYILAPFNH